MKTKTLNHIVKEVEMVSISTKVSSSKFITTDVFITTYCVEYSNISY